MNNIVERKKDILKIVSGLDISPTMYKNAVEKYHALANFLNDCGIEADIFPQGSFAFGTVVRPNAKDKDAGYDLDFICQVSGNRNQHTPSGLRKQVQEALESSNIYRERLKICGECFTIEYSDIGDIAFSIDIVPAVDESSENKDMLKKRAEFPELIDSAIAIPKQNGERNYNWLTNNPKGFKQWFDARNKPFLDAEKMNIRRQLFDDNRRIYASIEDVPEELERSALQRVIQILKCHRNEFYAKRKDGDELKPISAIINTVVTRIAEGHDPACSVFDLLEYVLNELQIYSKHQNMDQRRFYNTYSIERNIFTHDGNKWYIANPANPGDNLADAWNSNDDIPRIFFLWVNVAYQDLVGSLSRTDSDFRVAIENGLGSGNVKKSLDNKYCAATMPAPSPFVRKAAAKPYRKYDF